MDVLEYIRAHAVALPQLTKFALWQIPRFLFSVLRLSSRLRLPAVVGLLFAGDIVGPHVLQVFGEQRPVVDFFGDLGRLLLMFFAGLEVDLALFRRALRKTVTFGLPPADGCGRPRAWHLEMRYNYEAQNSVSGFVGRNVAFGTSVVLQMTPMLGALAGETTGIVPALELDRAWKRLEFNTEGEA